MNARHKCVFCPTTEAQCQLDSSQCAIFDPSWQKSRVLATQWRIEARPAGTGGLAATHYLRKLAGKWGTSGKVLSIRSFLLIRTNISQVIFIVSTITYMTDASCCFLTIYGRQNNHQSGKSMSSLLSLSRLFEMRTLGDGKWENEINLWAESWQSTSS